MDDEEGGGFASAEAPPDEPGLPSSLLDYGRLTLSGPDADARRGQLTPDSGLELVVVATASVSTSVVLRKVQAERARSQRVEHLPLPAGTQRVHEVASFDYLFRCESRLDIPSVAAWTQISVSASPVKLSAEYVTAPSVEEKVYRVLMLTNTSNHALLPGPVDVSVGDQFLLTSHLPAMPPDAGMPERLGLGVEEALTVVRRTEFKESTASFLGAGSRLLVHSLEVELRNRLGSDAKVRVLERLPHAAPEERDLKVEDVSAKPGWEEMPPDGTEPHRFEGARQWVVTVPAGNNTTLSAHYTIRLPASRMLVDGNRRS